MAKVSILGSTGTIGKNVAFTLARLDVIDEIVMFSRPSSLSKAEGEVLENDIYFEIVKFDKFNELNEDSLVFYKDYYVLIGKEEDKIDEPNEIINKIFGILCFISNLHIQNYYCVYISLYINLFLFILSSDLYFVK